jgi:hypothetical protein
MAQIGTGVIGREVVVNREPQRIAPILVQRARLLGEMVIEMLERVTGIISRVIMIVARSRQQ